MKNWISAGLLVICTILIFVKCSKEKCLTKCKDVVSNNCTPCETREFKCVNEKTNTPFKCNEIAIHFQELICEGAKDFLIRVNEEYNQKNDLNFKSDEIIEVNGLNEIYNNCDSIEILSLGIDLLIYGLVKKGSVRYLDSSLDTLNTIIDNSTTKKCMCDEDLILYNNPAVTMEGVIVQNGNGHLTQGEGSGRLALNYVVQPEGDVPNKFARSYDKERMSRLYAPTSIDENKPKIQEPIVAFLDSGIDPNLFDQDKYYNDGLNICLNDQEQINYKGWNFVDENIITHDDIGHGTLVAASYKNQMNVSDPYSILPVKVLDSCGYGTLYTTVCGLYYAKARGADIVNCSWGMYVNDTIMERAIREVSQDATVVTSAGNGAYHLDTIDHYPSEYSQLNWPNGYTNVIEVAGLCHDFRIINPPIKQFWNKSNYQKNNYAESAVGFSSIINTIPNSLKVPYDRCTCNGTSYSAPMITATLAKNHSYQDPNNILDDKKYERCSK